MLKNRVSATTHSSARLYAKVFAAHTWQALFARAPADMLRDVLGGEEPSAETFLREVAPALVRAMDEATLARVTEALRVRLDGSPGTPE